MEKKLKSNFSDNAIKLDADKNHNLFNKFNSQVKSTEIFEPVANASPTLIPQRHSLINERKDLRDKHKTICNASCNNVTKGIKTGDLKSNLFLEKYVNHPSRFDYASLNPKFYSLINPCFFPNTSALFLDIDSEGKFLDNTKETSQILKNSPSLHFPFQTNGFASEKNSSKDVNNKITVSATSKNLEDKNAKSPQSFLKSTKSCKSSLMQLKSMNNKCQNKNKQVSRLSQAPKVKILQRRPCNTNSPSNLALRNDLQSTGKNVSIKKLSLNNNNKSLTKTLKSLKDSSKSKISEISPRRSDYLNGVLRLKSKGSKGCLNTSMNQAIKISTRNSCLEIKDGIDRRSTAMHKTQVKCLNQPTRSNITNSVKSISKRNKINKNVSTKSITIDKAINSEKVKKEIIKHSNAPNKKILDEIYFTDSTTKCENSKTASKNYCPTAVDYNVYPYKTHNIAINVEKLNQLQKYNKLPLRYDEDLQEFLLKQISNSTRQNQPPQKEEQELQMKNILKGNSNFLKMKYFTNKVFGSNCSVSVFPFRFLDENLLRAATTTSEINVKGDLDMTRTQNFTSIKNSLSSDIFNSKEIFVNSNIISRKSRDGALSINNKDLPTGLSLCLFDTSDDHHLIRAFPRILRNRKILAKPSGALPIDMIYKYKVISVDGIQVPAMKLENAPMNLMNWTHSWQEMFCYNPRPYNVTNIFLNNYLVIRGIFEECLTKITDIIFLDPHTALHKEPYIYHAYLIPPICPHDKSIATSVQCYTSDNEYLAKGAWGRVSYVDKITQRRVENMKSINVKIPPVYPQIKSTLTPDNMNKKKPNNEIVKSLPVHLWVILGGKDMQALDGIAIIWKILRWVSEIPPSEFINMSEETRKMTEKQSLNQFGFLDWKMDDPKLLYAAYRMMRNNPTETKQNEELPTNINHGWEENYNEFGPFIFDTENYPESLKFKVAFILIDYPGYGNSTGNPSPQTIRTAVYLAVKHGINDLHTKHNASSIVLNVLGYSLGGAIALTLVADIAEAMRRDFDNYGIDFTSCGKNLNFRNEEVKLTHCSTNNIFSNNIDNCNGTTADIIRGNVYHKDINIHKRGNQGIKHNYVFDEKLLTFKDLARRVKLEKDVESTFADKESTSPRKYSGKKNEIEILISPKIMVNRLIMLAPFTSTQDMAQSITRNTMGSILSNALSHFVSLSIEWNNKKTLQRLFENMKDIKSKASFMPFRNFRMFILNGESDGVVPWTMGYELFEEARRLKHKYNFHNIPILFKKIPNETHSTILNGHCEMYILESCFCPYKLHPAGPLASLKFYAKELGLPRGIKQNLFFPFKAGLLQYKKLINNFYNGTSNYIQQVNNLKILFNLRNSTIFPYYPNRIPTSNILCPENSRNSYSFSHSSNNKKFVTNQTNNAKILEETRFITVSSNLFSQNKETDESKCSENNEKVKGSNNLDNFLQST